MRGDKVNFKERMELGCLSSFSKENVMKNLLKRRFTRVFNGIFGIRMIMKMLKIRRNRLVCSSFERKESEVGIT